jgi:hypothetical protein
MIHTFSKRIGKRRRMRERIEEFSLTVIPHSKSE